MQLTPLPRTRHRRHLPRHRHRHQRRHLRRGDGGFTLVELMLTIAILGVITIPLSNVVIGALHHQRATADRLALSHDAQISAAYFAQDVGSIGVRDYSVTAPPNSSQPYRPSIQLDAAYDAGGTVCGTAATPVARLRFLSDDWDYSGVTPAVGTHVVAYYLAGRELRRIKCAGATTPGSDIVLAHNVEPATLTVTCSTPCTAAAVPQQVALAFTVSTLAAGTHQITLNGQRRQT